MKLIIAGGRDYHLTKKDYSALDKILQAEEVTEVVSGGCRGVDKEGEEWAKSRSLTVVRFEADWTTHGKYAGPVRNRQMAEYADAVILFSGGRGTINMFEEAQKRNLVIYDMR